MRPNRPTSVLVIAILHFVFGGFGLVCAASTGAMQLAGSKGFMAGMQDAKQVKAQEETEKALQEKLPHAKAVETAETGISLALSLMMIVSGIGLLKMAPWGRSLSIGYALVSILVKILGAVYAFTFTVPVMKELLPKQIAAQAGNQPGEQQAAEMAQKFAEMALNLTPIIVLLTMIYPAVVLVIMFRPKVTAAFRGEMPSPQIEDYYDSDRTERLDQP